ncbi:MAG: WD40 repeat domain-containing protein [Gemmataceae bacterium]|nr:WD40 repeat domain-containing protein [Gemmataceae bacterium]
MRRHVWLPLACVLASATITAAQEKPALPEGSVARLGVPRLRVPEGIFDTGFSPDGRTFVIISRGKDGPWNVVLFDVATGLERKRINIRDHHEVAMARHRPVMVVITTKGFEVWDLATEKLVNQWPHPAPVWSTTALAISPDGTEIVAALGQRDKAVVLRWNAVTGKALPARYPTTSQICALSFSADGRKLLTASVETVVQVKDKSTTIPREHHRLGFQDRHEVGRVGHRLPEYRFRAGRVPICAGHDRQGRGDYRHRHGQAPGRVCRTAWTICLHARQQAACPRIGRRDSSMGYRRQQGCAPLRGGTAGQQCSAAFQCRRWAARGNTI